MDREIVAKEQKTLIDLIEAIDPERLTTAQLNNLIQLRTTFRRMPRKAPVEKPIEFFDAELQPWDRQLHLGESDQSYAAFKAYRDQPMGKRSVSEAARQVGSMVQTIIPWKKKFNWNSRVALWDAEQDRIYRLELEENQRGMAKRHAGLARLAQQKLLQGLQKLDGDTLTTADLIRLMDVSSKIERLALGLDNHDKLSVTIEVQTHMMQTVVHRLELAMVEVGIPVDQRQLVAQKLLDGGPEPAQISRMG
jgi:hypothetical protein